ncbi:MAG: Fic family protein, partial [Bacteroidia bacterium]|nr:Fic family protein [Bacteroidia bacterium]
MINRQNLGTNSILYDSIEIGKLLGLIDASHIRKPSKKYRRSNRIHTIHATLSLGGHKHPAKQIRQIFNNQDPDSDQKSITEVKNLQQAYACLSSYNFNKAASYLSAHDFIMTGLAENTGSFRSSGVRVIRGDALNYIAPPAWEVTKLMNRLFDYLKNSSDPFVIKSCVFHFEMEFIHPFSDGNGRLARLWQRLILTQENPVFNYLPIEKEMLDSMDKYHHSITMAIQQANCVPFVEYLLKVIRKCLQDYTNKTRANLSEDERLEYFRDNFKATEFARKDYMYFFRDISSATATRDMKL